MECRRSEKSAREKGNYSSFMLSFLHGSRLVLSFKRGEPVFLGFSDPARCWRWVDEIAAAAAGAMGEKKKWTQDSVQTPQRTETLKGLLAPRRYQVLILTTPFSLLRTAKRSNLLLAPGSEEIHQQLPCRLLEWVCLLLVLLLLHVCMHGWCLYFSFLLVFLGGGCCWFGFL